MRDEEIAILTDALATDLDRAFEEMAQRFGGRLFAVALRLTGSPADAEEIAQDALVRAHHALRGYEAARIRDLALRPWLYRITVNVARNRARGKRPVVVSLNGADRDDDGNRDIDPMDSREAPEATAERLEQGAELAALVAALPPRYRVAVVLRHIEGLAYAEIAETLEQPVGTVKANVHRGVRQLREALEQTNAARLMAVTEESR